MPSERSRRRCRNHSPSDDVSHYLSDEAWLADEITAAVAEADAPNAVFVTHRQVMQGLDRVITRARQGETL